MCTTKVAIGYIWLLDTCNVASATEELSFYIFQLSLSLNSYM